MEDSTNMNIMGEDEEENIIFSNQIPPSQPVPPQSNPVLSQSLIAPISNPQPTSIFQIPPSQNMPQSLFSNSQSTNASSFNRSAIPSPGFGSFRPPGIQSAEFQIYNQSLNLNNDEEFLMKPIEEIKELSSEPVTLKISSSPSKLKIGSIPTELICSLSLLGLSAELEVIEKSREGLDLVFVVDISGSMGSGKIDLVKITIEFVLTILRDFDRVSVIGFSDQAFIYCPLTVMNETGKEKVTRIVRELGPTGGTNIECGVRAALHSIADRKQTNQITAIMLLSDGVDNNTQTINGRIRVAIDEFKPRIRESFKLHTFGYGTDHDSKVMNLIAELTRGNFYYIENVASVNEAFSNCMGELVSLVASKIQASLTTLPCPVQFKMKKVYSANEDTVFNMPDLFFDDQQDAVFLLEFAASESPPVGQVIRPVKANVSYVLKGGSKVEKEVFLDVEIIGNDEEVQDNKEVLLEYYRVRGAEVLKQVTNLADRNNFEEARQAAQEFQKELERCAVKDNTKIQYLLRDIIDSQNRVQSRSTWDYGGRAQVSSVQNTHYNKISSNNCVSYQKPMQAMYTISSSNYCNSVPAGPGNLGINRSAPINSAAVMPPQSNLFSGPGLGYNYPPQVMPMPGPPLMQFQPPPQSGFYFSSPNVQPMPFGSLNVQQGLFGSPNVQQMPFGNQALPNFQQPHPIPPGQQVQFLSPMPRNIPPQSAPNFPPPPSDPKNSSS